MKGNHTQELLIQLGFTQNESTIYITLLRHGVLKAGELISKTKLQRSVVYTSLSNLLSKKLVHKKDTKVLQYYAADPERILEIQRENLKDAELLVTQLNKERTALEKTAFVYEGNDIVTTVAMKSLTATKGSTIYFFGPSKFGVQENLEAFWQKYHTKRESLQINAKILYDRFVPEDILKQRNTYKSCKAKYLPLHTEVPISFVIWDNHVAILVPGEKPPTVFFIHSPQTAETLIEYFMYMWKMMS